MDCGRLKELAIIMRLLFIFLLQLQCNLFVTESFDRSNLKNLNFTLPDGTSLDPKYWNKGKSVIYFGFSHCPDMCPFALTNFGRASMILGPLAREFRFVFITLDPERDAPSVLASYVNQFPGKNLQALSPANTSLLELETLFSITRKKVGVGTSYSMDHSNFIYLLDENLHQIAAFPGGTSGVELAKQLRKFSISN